MKKGGKSEYQHFTFSHSVPKTCMLFEVVTCDNMLVKNVHVVAATSSGTFLKPQFTSAATVNRKLVSLK